MSDLSERLKKLTPEQQKLLKLRMQKKGMEPAKKPEVPSYAPKVAKPKKRLMDFSIFFFSDDGTGESGNKYRLLMDAAQFADTHGFSAIWTPERHFQAFGGLYPNPSVLSSALAVLTKRLQIRAGSVVLPLHSPVRVAEEWALVDNLSEGRVGISFATGWHSHDYVIRPENYENRRPLMFENIQIVKRLWKGETVTLPGVNGQPVPVKTLPRPVQTDLPHWITANSPRTWINAGEIGANVLSIITTVEDLAGNIKAYRQARMENGHDPRKGIVSIMLHTYIDHDLDRARKKTREPLFHYLRNFLNQFRSLPGGDQFADEQGLLEFAFERYFTAASLLGTPEKCVAMLDSLCEAGVNDAACLIDFGIDYDGVMTSLAHLSELRQAFSGE